LNTFLQVGHKFKIALNASEGLGCDEGLCQQSYCICTTMSRAWGDSSACGSQGWLGQRDPGVNAMHLHAAVAEVHRWRSSHSFMNHCPFRRRTS